MCSKDHGELTVEIVSNLVPLRSIYRLLPFSFRSIVAICYILFRSRDTPTTKSVLRGTTVAKQGPIIVKKQIKGDIASTQLLEALPSHKTHGCRERQRKYFLHAAKNRKRNATETVSQRRF